MRTHGSSANIAKKGGDSETCRTATDSRGQFFVWGQDKNGQLGQNINKKIFMVPRPCIFRGAERVKEVSCGEMHSMILTMDGLVYAFGSNSGKQLGLRNQQADVKIPTLVEDLVNPNFRVT